MKYILAMEDMGSMPLKKSATRKAAGEPEGAMYRACLTLDQGTLDIIDELRRSKRMGRNSAVVRSIINAVLEGEITQSELRRFYSDIWTLVASRHDKKVTARFNWPPALDDALHALSMDILETDNKSEIFRIITACYAVKAGIVRVVWTKAAELEVKSSAQASKRDRH
jgi:hypothetical protein